MTVFIGDVHGKYGPYETILKAHENTIQVGDMGVGFRKLMGLGDNDPWLPNPPRDKMVDGNHRFIRGNHDNPTVCAKHSQWIPDGSVEYLDGRLAMFIGGASSIDKGWRTPGYSWWEDEELSYEVLGDIVEQYSLLKPDIMVTHECPELVAEVMMHPRGMFGEKSRTRQAFSTMQAIHAPEIWVFGHWHKSFDEQIDGTRYVCLNELEVREL